MGYRRALILLLAVSLATVSRAQPPSEELLQRATARVAANYGKFVSLTCVETIERDYYRPRKPPPRTNCPEVMYDRRNEMPMWLSFRDRLRLEVAVSSRGEIHAWPGSSRFSESSLNALVGHGPLGTGPFGVLLNLIFFHDVKKFAPLGEVAIDGRRSLTYQFSVPAADSHFMVRSEEDDALLVAGYEGVVRIDAETGDPIAVTVTANDPPAATGACQTTSTVQLKRSLVRGEEILMPELGRLVFVGSTGIETRSRITFSACRQYSSESTVTFGSEGASKPVGPGGARPLARRVPDSIPFEMELLNSIDSDTAAAGDRFTARLTEPLKDGRRLIAPKGAVVEGRISDVWIQFNPRQVVMFGLLPESVDTKGGNERLAARLDTRMKVISAQMKKRKGLEFLLPERGQSAHQFRLDGTHAILPKGFRSNWVTALPKMIKDSVP